VRGKLNFEEALRAKSASSLAQFQKKNFLIHNKFDNNFVCQSNNLVNNNSVVPVKKPSGLAAKSIKKPIKAKSPPRSGKNRVL